MKILILILSLALSFFGDGMEAIDWNREEHFAFGNEGERAARVISKL